MKIPMIDIKIFIWVKDVNYGYFKQGDYFLVFLLEFQVLCLLHPICKRYKGGKGTSAYFQNANYQYYLESLGHIVNLG